MKYDLTYSVVRILRFFTVKGSSSYYNYTFLMEDILDEANAEYMHRLLNMTW